MLMSFDEASKLINEGRLLHIAGAEDLIKRLPKGKWAGGSTEYFMAAEGGKVSGDLLFVTEFPYDSYSIKSYDEHELKNVAVDAYANGFSIAIVPFDSAVHKEYAQNAQGYEDMFIKEITGWVSGINLGVAGQTPVSANGSTGEIFSDRAVVLHLDVPHGKTASINIVNIFSQDEASPLIEFTEEGFSARTCLVDGQSVAFADYIAKNNINTKLPLVGDYSGSGVNISVKSIEDGVVNFYAPVFTGIKYRMAKDITDYEQEFRKHLKAHDGAKAVFSCNCILNFLYGELENKKIENFAGPITFGEIAYQLVNQTLVYVVVL